METSRSSEHRVRGLSFAQYLSTSRGREAGEVTEWSSNAKMKSLVQKLLASGCPYLEAMEEAEASAVMLTPGEARMRLLTWLASRVHPSLQGYLLDTSFNILTAPKLSSLLHDLGLCTKEDHDLVLGTDGSSKQLLFLDALLDLVLMAGWDGDSSFTDKLQSVPWQMGRCCQFLDDLCLHEDLRVTFPSTVSLVPPGISIAAGSRGVTGSGPEKKTSPPSLSELMERCEHMRGLLEKKQLQLEAIMQEHTYEELKPGALDSCHKMMGVSLETLAQLAASFCTMYEEEVRPWCSSRDAPPPTSSLGPVCQRVALLKVEIDKLFQALGVMEASFRKLDELKLSRKQWNTGDICVSAYQTLKDCLTVLTAN